MTDERKAPVYDTSGYVGVDPMYQNYADETHRPILTDADRRMMKDHGLWTDAELDYQTESPESVAMDIVAEVDARSERSGVKPEDQGKETKPEPKKPNGNGKTKPDSGLII